MNPRESNAVIKTVMREYHAVEGGKHTLARLAKHLATKGVAA